MLVTEGLVATRAQRHLKTSSISTFANHSQNALCVRPSFSLTRVARNSARLFQQCDKEGERKRQKAGRPVSLAHPRPSRSAAPAARLQPRPSVCHLFPPQRSAGRCKAEHAQRARKGEKEGRTGRSISLSMRSACSSVLLETLTGSRGGGRGAFGFFTTRCFSMLILMMRARERGRGRGGREKDESERKRETMRQRSALETTKAAASSSGSRSV